MVCKNCGGELLFEGGIWSCHHCGATGALDSVYENIDVCICYEENDAAGRRTQDSIIAQEIYRKLEENKIATFCERISADGIFGDDLEASKLAAIRNAKMIIALGTSVENFVAIEKKYGAHFAEKPVVPFCVDVNPGRIPKTLSKIQAMSYSTIGWDKDLIKGVFNILGKNLPVDTSSLYGRRKTWIIAISTVVVALALVLAALFVKRSDADANTQVETTETTIRPLTSQDVYEQACQLAQEGKNIEALNMFAQISDYADSANKIQLIYAQYEGYYQNETISIHFSVFNNVRAELEVMQQRDDRVIRCTMGAELLVDQLSGEYEDNFQKSGKLQLVLEDTGLRLYLQEEQTEYFFAIADKTDQPMLQIEKETLTKWLKERTPISQILALGYELEQVEKWSRGTINVVCRIKNTEIYITFASSYYSSSDDDYQSLEEDSVLGITAPAEIVAPELIGKKTTVKVDGNILYRKNAYLDYPVDWFELVDETYCNEDGSYSDLRADWPEITKGKIKNNTMICMVYRKNFIDWEWEGFLYAAD